MRPNNILWSKNCFTTLIVTIFIILSLFFSQFSAYANEADHKIVLNDNLTITVVNEKVNTSTIDENKYQNKPLKVLDVSEVIMDGASTLVITFSIPLDKSQDFSSLVNLVDKNKGNVDGDWELSDNQLELRHRYLEPNRELTLTINKRLKAINNALLYINYKTTLTTQKREAVVGFASTGSLIPVGSVIGLPVMTLDVNLVDVNFYKIKPNYLYEFLAQMSNVNNSDYWLTSNALKYTDLVYTGRFDLETKPNVQGTVLLDLSNIEALQQEGFYFAVMNVAGTYKYSNPVTMFSISNIGVSAHYYANKSIALFTQSLDDGKPITDVEIRLIGKDQLIINAGKTDENGFLSFNPNTNENNFILVASKNGHSSFIELGRNALDLSEFNITGNKYYDKQLVLFGPRNLYRPGETVFLNALLRDADGKPVANQPIKVEIVKSDGEVVLDYVWQPIKNQEGFYQTQYILPKDASTGKWAFRFNTGDDNKRYSYFMVETFLPERMDLDLRSTSSQPILNKDDVTFNVKGWYHYGAPANGNELNGQVFVKAQRQIVGLKGFEIGQIDDESLNQFITNVDQLLDHEGLTKVKVKSNDWGNIKSPASVVLQASLLDTGGRPITRYASQVIWPAQTMPAIRALFSTKDFYDWSENRYVSRPTVDKGAIAQFEVINVNTNGQRDKQSDFTARIIKERRDYYWVWSENDGWKHHYSEKQFTVFEEKLKFNNGSARVAFLADDWGSYRIEVKDNKTNVVSSMRFWSGYFWSDNTNGTGSVRPDQVKLSIDKLSYSPGDTAKVLIEAPAAGTGYLAVESNDGVLWSKAIDVPDGGIEVAVPVDNWQRHDIYISAIVVRGNSNELQTENNQTIKRAVGLIYLPFNVEQRRLDLAIEAPEKVEPERAIAIKVSLPKQQLDISKKVTVLLSAVDTGVLNITNFRTPDPFSGFLGRKRYEVDQYDVYGKLIEQKGRYAKLRFGGDSDNFASSTMISNGSLSDATIIAQQLESIQLDENGEGIIHLTLPDFNGELRLMAQVWDESRFGKAEKLIKVASPMIAELSMPRYLSGGDQSQLTLDLRNLSLENQTITVNLSTEGLINLSSENQYTMTFGVAERKLLPILIHAEHGVGEGIVKVSIDGLNKDQNTLNPLERRWQINVRPAYAPEQRHYDFIVNEDKKWQLPEQAVDGLLANTITAQLALSNHSVINIAQYIKTLKSYPYGCLEQTISGLYPSLFINSQQLQALGISGETDELRRRNIDIGIERIFSMQRKNGSFGLWSKESDEDHWLTVYAVDFLLRAKEYGYNVNTKALTKALDRIAAYLYDHSAFDSLQNSYYAQNSEYLIFSVKTYAAMILTREGKITPAVRNELNHLYISISNETDHKLKAALPAIQLAIASKYAGYSKSVNKLTTIALNHILDTKASHYGFGDYGSPIRDNALIIFLLLDNGLELGEVNKLLPVLANDLNVTDYLSTQELNAVFLAGWLANYRQTSETWIASINNEMFKQRNTLIRLFDIEQIKQGVTIHNPQQNLANLYGRIDITGYSTQPPVATSDDDTLTITRTYYDLKGNVTSIDSLQSGDLVLVLLDVKAKRRIADALIVDMLPAGLELENQNLEGSSVNIMAIPGIANLLKDENSYDIKYQEYRDDRYVAAVDIKQSINNDDYSKKIFYLVRAVTPGKYLVPAPTVTSMYNPSWFAIGKTSNLMEITRSK
jgi:alpha-2-macroglobulin